MQFVKSVIVSIFGKQKIPYSLNAKKSKEQKENTDIMSITLPFNIYVHLSWKERDRVKEKNHTWQKYNGIRRRILFLSSV